MLLLFEVLRAANKIVRTPGPVSVRALQTPPQINGEVHKNASSGNFCFGDDRRRRDGGA